METREKVVDSASSAMYIRQLRGDIERLEGQIEDIRERYKLTLVNICLCITGVYIIYVVLKIRKRNKLIATVAQKIKKIEDEISAYDQHRL